MQNLLNKQCKNEAKALTYSHFIDWIHNIWYYFVFSDKADKLAEIEKTERQVQQQQERDDEMREMALRLRRR